MTTYKGYELRPLEGKEEIHIYLNGEPVGGVVRVLDKMTVEEKAKFKIDCWLSGKDYGTEYMKILKGGK